MLGPRLRQVLGGAALTALLLMAATGVSLAEAAATCDLTVKPASGPPGTEFVFSGSGYSPTELRLTRDGAAPRVVPLSPAGADPFQFSIVAGDADVGKWKAVAVDAAKNCEGTATIRIVLPGTSTLAESAPADKTPVLAAFAGLAGVFVLSAAFILRRSRRPI
jgi:hypothetical protein